MRCLFISSFGLAFTALPNGAHAAPEPVSKMLAGIDELPDLDSAFGESSISGTRYGEAEITASLKGWDLSMTGSYVGQSDRSVARDRAPRVAIDGRTDQHGGRGAMRLTSVKIAAERAVPLGHGIKLDLLARATLPTSRTATWLGEGHTELMLDAGLRKNIGRTSVWAGGARRFRNQGFEATGRDVFETYAGMKRQMDSRTTMRVDYVRTQAEYRGDKPDQSASFEISHALKSGATLDFAATHWRGSYYKGGEAAVSLRWTF